MSHGRNADMRLIEQPFLSGLFLKGLACNTFSGRVSINIKTAGGTCLPAPGAWWLQCHALGQALWASITGGSAIIPYLLYPFVSPGLSCCFPMFAMFPVFKPPELMCSPGGSPFVSCPAKQVHPAGTLHFPKRVWSNMVCVCVCVIDVIDVIYIYSSLDSTDIALDIIGWKAGRDPIKATAQLVPFFFLQPEYTQLIPKQQCTWSMTL